MIRTKLQAQAGLEAVRAGRLPIVYNPIKMIPTKMSLFTVVGIILTDFFSFIP